MDDTPLSRGLLERLRQLAVRARAAHRRSSQEWVRRIEAPPLRSDLD